MNAVQTTRPASLAQILILPDGTVLAHNLTPEAAAVLAELNPDDALMRRRAEAMPGRQPGPGGWGGIPERVLS